MPGDEKLLKRRELIKRIALAGATPAVVAIIAGGAPGEVEAQSDPPPPPPPPPSTPEPGTIVLTGLGLAGAAAVAAFRKRRPPDGGSKS